MIQQPATDPTTRGAIGIGVDTGGTHTDLVLAGNGIVRTLKVPTTPDDLGDGILHGLMRILEEAGLDAADVGRFIYASTFVTNLIVERRERSLGLITTEGFRDVLEIGRASRKPDVYDLHWRPPAPLVPRYLRQVVRERIDHRGGVIEPLDDESAIAALRRLAEHGVHSIAVCLLHAYANPAHERRIAELAAEVCPGIEISISSEVVREFREYERSSTTCIDAFIKLPIRRHLRSLQQRLERSGVHGAPFIMQGNGGVSSFESACRLPIGVTHSGVVGGIVGATALAASCGIRDIITLDMGGTSADVALVAGGQPVLAGSTTVGDHPLLAPTLDMVTIGAGGGSMAWVEGGSALRVGPRSAGSVPGPVCYGQGGRAVTVTDANLVAGRLNPDYFLAGARKLHPELAAQAMRELGDSLAMSPEAAALGVIAIAEAHMANAMRLVSVERGLDPRDFTLVAFGGAGALHATQLAEVLSISRILIPPAPGNLSAMGLLCADVRHDLARTRVATLGEIDAGELSALYRDLLDEAERALVGDRVPRERRHYTLSADLRYQGQNYDLNLEVTQRDVEQGFAQLAGRFHDKHQRVYGYELPARSLQLVNARVSAIGANLAARWPSHSAAGRGGQAAGERRVLLGSGEWVSAPVYRLATLPPGFEVSGPAIIEYPGSTLYLAPGWRASFDAMLNAHLASARASSGAANSFEKAAVASEARHVEV